MRQDEGGFERREVATVRKPMGGLAGWLLDRWQGRKRAPARLAVLERIALAPRQSLALVEAEGRRFLLATSPEGTPAFYPLESGRTTGGKSEQTNGQRKDRKRRGARVVAW